MWENISECGKLCKKYLKLSYNCGKLYRYMLYYVTNVENYITIIED